MDWIIFSNIDNIICLIEVLGCISLFNIKPTASIKEVSGTIYEWTITITLTGTKNQLSPSDIYANTLK